MTFPDLAHALAWTGALGWPAALSLFWLISRRLKRLWAVRAVAAMVSAAWGLAVWGFLIEPTTLAVRRVEVASPTWTGAPLTIGVISDVHVGGPHMRPARVARVVERMNAEAPDLIVLVGDYIAGHREPPERSDRENAALEAGVVALGGLEAPLGVVAVLGNHDWWYDGPRVEAWLTGAGVEVLENETIEVAREAGSFWIAGFADFHSERAQPAFARTLANVPETDDVIGLEHWPDGFDFTPARVGLTISGHSHCGQLRFPIVGRPFTVSGGSARWPCGLYDEDGRLLYVTGGVGTSVLPARFGARPEIVVIMLSAED